MSSKNYHKYVIEDGKFIGKFEEMYQEISDPWACLSNKNSLGNDILLLLMKHLKHKNKKKISIFDVGCGLGGLTKRIKTLFPEAKIYACDVSSSAILKAKKRKGIEFFVYDILNQSRSELFLKDNSLDLIVMSQVIFYLLPRLSNILELFYKLLTDGGGVIIQQAFFCSDVQKYGNKIFEKTTDLKKYLSQAGFEICSHVDFNPSNELHRPQNCIVAALKDAPVSNG